MIFPFNLGLFNCHDRNRGRFISWVGTCFMDLHGIQRWDEQNNLLVSPCINQTMIKHRVTELETKLKMISRCLAGFHLSQDVTSKWWCWSFVNWKEHAFDGSWWWRWWWWRTCVFAAPQTYSDLPSPALFWNFLDMEKSEYWQTHLRSFEITCINCVPVTIIYNDFWTHFYDPNNEYSPQQCDASGNIPCGIWVVLSGCFVSRKVCTRCHAPMSNTLKQFNAQTCEPQWKQWSSWRRASFCHWIWWPGSV